jgi:hypothetical protein
VSGPKGGWGTAHHQERVGLASFAEHAEGPREPRAVQRLGARTRVHDHLDELQVVQLGVGGDLRALRVEADAAVGLPRSGRSSARSATIDCPPVL